MIIQGSNIPITIEFSADEPAVLDISVSLSVPGQEVKHWDKDDLTISEDNLTFTAEITQTESLNWETGNCTIQVKWTDEDGQTQFAIARDKIVEWTDKCVLAEEEEGDDTE